MPGQTAKCGWDSFVALAEVEDARDLTEVDGVRTIGPPVGTWLYYYLGGK